MLEKEGYALMGAAFEVYNILGHGFLEEVYQQSLEIELTKRRIPFIAQHALTLHYKETPLAKTYIADLVGFGEIIIELKAANHLAPEHIAQLMNYLKVSNRSIGYLINFGNPEKLEWRRIALE